MKENAQISSVEFQTQGVGYIRTCQKYLVCRHRGWECCDRKVADALQVGLNILCVGKWQWQTQPAYHTLSQSRGAISAAAAPLPGLQVAVVIEAATALGDEQAPDWYCSHVSAAV